MKNGVTQLPSLQHSNSVLPDKQSRTGPLFSFHALPAFSLSVTRPQAVPLSRVLSQMRLFSPAPHFRRTAALTRSAALLEGLNQHWPGADLTQELSRDHAAAAAVQRLQSGASLPQKKLTRSCSSSISGIMENRNTHLAPGFTLNDLAPAPANVAALWSLLGDRKSTRLNSSHKRLSRMPSSA